LLLHIGPGISTPRGCCDVYEPDLSVALDVVKEFTDSRGNGNSGFCTCEFLAAMPVVLGVAHLLVEH
jgi:hypothetical protein